jgi:hypothetical protein
MITIAADSEGTADQRVKDAFFIVEPNQKQPVEIAQQLDAGRLRAFVKTTVPLNEGFGRVQWSSHGQKRIQEDRYRRSRLTLLRSNALGAMGRNPPWSARNPKVETQKRVHRNSAPKSRIEL